MISRFTRKDFLEALFLDYYKEHRGFILVKSLKRGDQRTATRYFPNIDILAKEHYAEERDVYYGVCPRERMKSEKEHIHFVVSLWADLDIGPDGHGDKKVFFEGPQQAARAIRSFPRAPSIIVESGRGAHLYWLLKEVVEVDDPERVESIIRKINEHLNCDTDPNLDTVLRLPETVNTKIPDQPVNCDVKFINTNFRYTFQDFENLGQRLVAPAAPPSRPASQPAPTPSPPDSFSQEDEVIPPTADGGAINDSLIVDETIIDELIDDISMTATSVSEQFMPDTEAREIEPPSDPADEPVTYDRPLEETYAPPPVDSPRAPYQGAGVGSSAVLEGFVESGTQLSVSLMGSGTVIDGTLARSEDGLIVVESEGEYYTIPLTSIEFIKSYTL